MYTRIGLLLVTFHLSILMKYSNIKFIIFVDKVWTWWFLTRQRLKNGDKMLGNKNITLYTFLRFPSSVIGVKGDERKCMENSLKGYAFITMRSPFQCLHRSVTRQISRYTSTQNCIWTNPICSCMYSLTYIKVFIWLFLSPPLFLSRHKKTSTLMLLSLTTFCTKILRILDQLRANNSFAKILSTHFTLLYQIIILRHLSCFHDFCF